MESADLHFAEPVEAVGGLDVGFQRQFDGAVPFKQAEFHIVRSGADLRAQRRIFHIEHARLPAAAVNVQRLRIIAARPREPQFQLEFAVRRRKAAVGNVQADPVVDP